MYDVDWRAIGAGFVLAALSLPQPFAIVESGNFCGGTTGMLALLRRELCPRCPYVSLDPGAYRVKRHASIGCHRAALEFAGLSDQVTFVEEPSAALGALEPPVGFMYIDGGKVLAAAHDTHFIEHACDTRVRAVLESAARLSTHARRLHERAGAQVRFSNAPLHAYVEDRLMVGGLIGLDDAWQSWPNAPHAREHVGQSSMVHELVAAGDFEALVVPPAHHASPKARAMLAAIRGSQATPGGAAPTAAAAGDATRGGSAAAATPFPENVKQLLVMKARSRFEQPGERSGLDALRVVLVERGGVEAAPALWVALPETRSGERVTAERASTHGGRHPVGQDR